MPYAASRPAASGLIAALGLSLTLTLAPTSAQAMTAVAEPVAGSGRGADTLFPFQGNGGYDVRHYNVRMRYRPASNHLAARVRIRAVAPAPLSSYHLDLDGLRILRIGVNGQRATFSRHGHELVVTPAVPVVGAFTTRIRYAGRPHVHIDTDGSTEGLVPTADGAIALGQPIGAVAWLPTNNTLGDKASWSFHVTAPSGLRVAANGLLHARVRHGSTTTWDWRAPDPMPTELATVAIGDFRVHKSTYTSITGRQIPLRSYIDRGMGSARQALATLPQVLRFEEQYFGPYPFVSAGMIVDPAKVGYALETMTRPFYPYVPPDGLIVHEMAHQWYGDSLTPTDWHDIWLNEGFAEYAQWLWYGTHGGLTPAQHFQHLYARPATAAVWRPGVRTFTKSADLFGEQTYDRGAMTLQALRQRVGDPAFFEIIKTWASTRRFGSVTTPQFVALAERISGRDLGSLFHDWLDVAGKPVGY